MIKALLLQDFSGNEGLIMRHASRISVTTPSELDWSLDGERAPGIRQAEIVNLQQRLRMQI